MTRGKLVFGTWPEDKRKFITVISYSVILFSVCALLFSIISITYSKNFHNFPLILAGISMAFGGLFFCYLAHSRELKIYVGGIFVPLKLGGQFIPFSDLLEIRLNTKGEVFNPNILLILRDGRMLTYSKHDIPNIDKFYEIMYKYVAKKVRVVE